MGALLTSLVLALAPAADATAILVRHECHRCHVVENVPAYGAERGCAGCHIDISTAPSRPARDAEGRADFGAAWDGFVARTGRHYVAIPSLVGLDRFRASWLRAFLGAPYDLRPHLDESMIRHALTPAEIDTLVSGTHARPDTADTSRAATNITLGESLYDALDCSRCHQFAHRPATGPASLERSLAPDLRHARDRLDRPTLLAWLRNPASLKADTHMPPVTLPTESIEALADFVLGGAIEVRAAVVVPEPSAPALRPTWENVERVVLRDTCWHCHSDPDPETGDGEPGNTGGFGFAAAGLSFESYASMRRGAIGPDGKRHSVVTGVGGRPAPILERLRRRHDENARDHVVPGESKAAGWPGTDVAPLPRGMPLGLPALPDWQVDLVARWVAAGAPGPGRR